MRPAELHWFQLRFPEGLDELATLAALASFAGLPHRGRVKLQLAADNTGISHQLGVSAAETESVIGGLRAAIPSLRLESMSPPDLYGRSWLWQLSPRSAALRVDDLAGAAAALLSACFPLKDKEALSLTWHLRSAPRPPFPLSTALTETGQRRALRLKLDAPGLSVFGELHLTAASSARRRVLTQRIASVLRSLSTPHGRLAADEPWLGRLARLAGLRGRYFSTKELAAVLGWPIGSPDLPGLTLGAAKRLVPTPALAEDGRRLGMSDFVGVSRPVCLSEQASTRGFWALGPTGTGKTSLLKNLIRDDLEAGRGLVVLETNGDLITETLDSLPKRRVRDVVLLDPTDSAFAVGFNPLAGPAEPSLVADQLGELFQRIWSAYWGPRTAQLAHMGLLTLARRQGSTLLDLPRLFLDEVFRERVLADLDDPVGLGPDWQWYLNLPIREQAAVVAPLLNKVRAMTARPSIRAIVGQAEPRISLPRLLNERKVLLVNLPKGLIGSETAQLLGCLILTGLWQAFAERVALAPGDRHAFGLYVDEVQDFASAPVPWGEMFAQGRKYGLALSVAHQNLDQLPKELRATMLANARSKAVFGLSATDAKALERVFAPALTAADLQALDPFTIAAVVATDDGGVSRPVTLKTPPPLKPTNTATSVRAASRQQFARRIEDVEATLRGRVTRRAPKAAPVGRKQRSRS